MAIAYKSAGAGGGTEVQATQLALACPAVVATNDILVAHVNATGLAWAPTDPGDGWEPLYGPAPMGTGTAVGRSWVYGKMADGTEDAETVNFGVGVSTEGRWGRIYSFDGWVSGSLAEIIPADSFSDIPKEDDPALPTVTTSKAGALAVALIAQDDNNTLAAGGAQTGGTWAEPVAEFVSTTLGPQGVNCQVQTCTPTADPGTVTGGVLTTQADESSTIGFEIRDSLPTFGPFTVVTRTTPGDTPATNHTVLLANGSDVVGKRVIIAFSAEASIAWPSGWTELRNGSTTATVLSFAYRDIDGTEGFDGVDDSITVTTGASVRSNAHARTITGHDPGTAPVAPVMATDSTAAPDPPSTGTLPWGSAEALFIPVASQRFAGNYTAAPSGYAGLASLNGGDDNAPLGSAHRAATVTSEDPGTFTQDGGSMAWVAGVIAVRPTVGTPQAQADWPVEAELAATTATNHAAQAGWPVDVALDTAAATDAQAQAGWPVEATFAAVTEAPSAPPAAAQADWPVDVTLEASTAADAGAQADWPVDVALEVSTAAGHAAQVDQPVDIALDVVTSAPSGTQAGWPVDVALDVVTATDAAAQADLPVDVAFAATTNAPSLGVPEAQVNFQVDVELAAAAAAGHTAQVDWPVDVTLAVAAAAAADTQVDFPVDVGFGAGTANPDVEAPDSRTLVIAAESRTVTVIESRALGVAVEHRRLVAL